MPDETIESMHLEEVQRDLTDLAVRVGVDPEMMDDAMLIRSVGRAADELRGTIKQLVSVARILLEVIAEPNSIVQDTHMDNAIQAMSDAIDQATTDPSPSERTPG